MADNTTRRVAQAAFYVALAAAILGAIALPALAAETPTVLTIADGPVQVLRGASRLDVGEGFALADDDIVRTAPSARVARIEFADGRALDLGPATQVLLLSPRLAHAQGWPGATALTLQGWAKLSAGSAAGSLVMPHAVAAGEARGALLVHVAPDRAALAFAEAGGLTLSPRGVGGAEVLLREGESWTRDASSAAVRVSARAAGLREMPRALADTLPRRAALFASRDSDAAGSVPIEDGDLAPWARAEPQLLAQLKMPRAAGSQRAGSAAAARRPDPLKWARHDQGARRAAPRAVARGTARMLPATSVAAAATLGRAGSIALEPTVFVTAEPVATVNLPTAASLVVVR